MRKPHPKKTRVRAIPKDGVRLGAQPAPEEDTQERAFLVGLDVRTRGRSGARVTPQAQAARDAATASSSDETVGTPAHASAKSTNKPSIPEFDADESLAELRTLAGSAGAKIVGEILQRRDRPDPATLIGAGKLEEIAGAAASVNADLLLFDHDLTASQQRNIEKIVKRRVIDRTQLILDIFARHARTREGQLQVELAQLQYMLPRLAGHGTELGSVMTQALDSGADVRALVWRSHPDQSGYSQREALHIGEVLNPAGGEVLLDERVRRFGSHHQKIVLIHRADRPGDDVAFMGGIDLCHGRGDDGGRFHRFRDRLRCRFR